MRRGDPVVVLGSGHSGTIAGIDLPTLHEPDCIVLVQRDDLEPHFAPIPYDAHELEVCSCEQDGCAWSTVAEVKPPLCLHSGGCAVRRYAQLHPPTGCCREPA